MNKKQTVFLSAILGIGSIMMLSFLIISATKAKPDCVVSDDLTVTGNVNVGGTLRVPDNGINMISATSNTAKGIIMGVKTLTGMSGNDLSLSPFVGHEVSLGGNSRAVGNFRVGGNTTLGDDASDKVNAYQYCNYDGTICHDASEGWGGGISCHNVEATCDSYGCAVLCDSGTVTGGGCSSGGGETVANTMPLGNGWYCQTLETTTITAYAICCE